MRQTALALAVALAPVGALADCAETTVDLRGDWGSARFTVEIADTAQTRAQGLMHRPSMPKTAGMLFVYDRPQRASFWMENTLIPLDMIFIDPTGTVTRVHENAVPLDRTPIDGGGNVLYVLEINGGLSDTLGIAPGSEVRHPAIDPAIAVWPCE